MHVATIKKLAEVRQARLEKEEALNRLLERVKPLQDDVAELKRAEEESLSKIDDETVRSLFSNGSPTVKGKKRKAHDRRITATEKLNFVGELVDAGTTSMTEINRSFSKHFDLSSGPLRKILEKSNHFKVKGEGRETTITRK